MSYYFDFSETARANGTLSGNYAIVKSDITGAGYGPKESLRDNLGYMNNI